MIQEIYQALNLQNDVFHVELIVLRCNMTIDPGVPRETFIWKASFTDAETAEYLPQEVVRGEFAGDRAQGLLGLAEFLGK